MSGIKRFGSIMFGIAGILCLCGLALPWVGPFQRQATSLMHNWYYYNVMQALIAVSGVGAFVSLLRGLLTPPQRKTVVIDQAGDDQITVTTAAISSQATHVIETDDRFTAEKVRVSSNRKGEVQLDVRIRPQYPVDVSAEGRYLHDALQLGMQPICGDRVQRINLEFLEAAHVEDNAVSAGLEELAGSEELAGREELVIPQSVYDRAASLEAPTETTMPQAGADASPSSLEDEFASYETEGEVR